MATKKMGRPRVRPAPCDDCFAALLRHAAREQGVDKKELARRLGVWRNRVNVIFETPNMTERVFKETAEALGMRVEVRLVRKARK